MDPDPDSDSDPAPAIFVIDLQDVKPRTMQFRVVFSLPEVSPRWPNSIVLDILVNTRGTFAKPRHAYLEDFNMRTAPVLKHRDII